MGLFSKNKLERIMELERLVSELESKNAELNNRNKEYENAFGSLKEVEVLVDNKRNELQAMNDKIENSQNQIQELQEQIKVEEKNIEEKNQEIEKLNNSVENVLDIIETNVYENPYNYDDSQSFQSKLDEIRNAQKEMVKQDKAMYHSRNLTMDDSHAKGKRMMKDIDKLALRSFNNECGYIITNTRYSNASTSENKIKKSFEAINKTIKMFSCNITEEYLQLKLDELALKVGYETKKEEEKEEQRRIREIMKEEERVRKEIEDAKARVEKDEKHFNNEISKLEKKLAKEKGDKQELLGQIAKLKSKLEELAVVKQDVLNREMNTRAGYVYVISNIGSFGEDVYKIGVTRRLDPMIRVNELSSASVPFKFDVHAMIFADDAFELETNLHRIFDKQRVNKINGHKEFFAVSLDEIEKAVHEFNPTVEFTRTALAEEYRLSMNM